MALRADRPHFDDPTLDAKIRNLRVVDNVTNLVHLVAEYVGIAATIGGAVYFGEYRASWGLAWAWNVPVFALAVALIGGFQHRLAGLGHEASHYTFLRDKRMNDLVADVFCMFPILTNLHFYRLFHLAHHQYTNDWGRDPDLVNMGRSKGVADFPMPRKRVLMRLHLRALTVPLAFLKYQWDYIYVNVLGKGGNVYMGRVEGGDGAGAWPRLGTMLGLAYALGFNAAVLAAHVVGECGPARAGGVDWHRARGIRRDAPAGAGHLPLAIPPGLLAEGRRDHATRVPDGRDGRARLHAASHGRAVGGVRGGALGPTDDDDLYGLYASA